MGEQMGREGTMRRDSAETKQLWKKGSTASAEYQLQPYFSSFSNLQGRIHFRESWQIFHGQEVRTRLRFRTVGHVSPFSRKSDRQSDVRGRRGRQSPSREIGTDRSDTSDHATHAFRRDHVGEPVPQRLNLQHRGRHSRRCSTVVAKKTQHRMCLLRSNLHLAATQLPKSGRLTTVCDLS